MNQYLNKPPLIFLVLLFIVTVAQNVVSLTSTRTVSVNVNNLPTNPVKIYFVCPNVKSILEFVEYYRIKDGKRTKLSTDLNAYGVLIAINNKDDLGLYECDVVSKTDKTISQLIVVDEAIERSPEKLMYKQSESIRKITPIGQKAELTCGSTTTGDVTWYKPAQYVIYKGAKLVIDKVSNYDYGTYFCVVGNTKMSTVNGLKVRLLPNDQIQQEKSTDSDVSHIFAMTAKSNVVRYRPSQLKSRNESVTWEQPAGTILLNHGRDIYVENYNITGDSQTFFYRIQEYGNPEVNTVGKVIISKAVKKDIELTFMDTPKVGEEIKLNCNPGEQFGKDAEVVWKLNDKIVHRGNTLTIKRFDAKLIGSYKCEIQKKGTQIRSRAMNFERQVKGQRGKIEMIGEPGSYNIFHKGSKTELHCEIERVGRAWEVRSKDIKWTFNGKIIDVNNKRSAFGDINRFGRLDTLTASILILQDMDKDNEGSYKCFKGASILATNLIMEPDPILIELTPAVQTVVHNKQQASEFHCRISSRGLNSSFIKWSFIPDNSNGEEQALPAEAVVTRPSIAETTSFVSITNSLKRHEGKYVCRVVNAMTIGTLIVIQNAVIELRPKVITVKPDGEARFLCTLSNGDGKLIWRRKDRKNLEINRENRLGGSAQSILEIKRVKLSDDGTQYECVYKNLIETATLYVKDDCPLSQRKCSNGTCIDETKFCDGKNDCGDNSDEEKTRCNECSPNSIHCDFINGSDPTRRCVIKHWKCDGVNDCGNNFDETQCPVKNKDKCIGTHYLCNNETLIPRSYWCDGEIDCKSGEDEEQCSDPQVIEPSGGVRYSLVKNNQLVLTCKVVGRPVATITWRYNWGYLQKESNFSITEQVDNCSVITSTLTINNTRLEDSGVYTCEAIARRRVMAPDFLVTVSKEHVCKKPFFNNDASVPDFCIRCYCSNVTDDCTSATGYATASKPVMTAVKSSDAAIINAKTLEYFTEATGVNFIDTTNKTYYISPSQYKKFVPSPEHYFGGSFNMKMSWLLRYGYPLTFTISASGEDKTILQGPLLALVGDTIKTVYYCPPTYKIWVHPSNDNYTNKLQAILWEKDFWYSSFDCSEPATRDEFMNILAKYRMLLIRVKYFKEQTDFRMSSLSFEIAEKAKTEHSWAAKIEKCNCPKGYKGLSCEISLENKNMIL